MKRFRSLPSAFLLFSALVLAAPVQAAPQTFEIDPVHSRVEFTIRHMFSKVTGNFGKFQGVINYDAAAPASSSVKAERSEEHTSELQSPYDLVCRLLLE